eukprot:5352255-Prymnesium_polylepis.1
MREIPRVSTTRCTAGRSAPAVALSPSTRNHVVAFRRRSSTSCRHERAEAPLSADPLRARHRPPSSL